MRVLYTSDVHGDEGHYGKLLVAAESVKPDLVILGGDLLPDDSALEPETLGHGQPEYVKTVFRKYMTDLRGRCGCQGILTIFGNHDWGSSVPAMEELARDGLVTVLDHRRCVGIDGLNFVGYSCTPPTPWFVKDFERLDRPGDRPPLIGGARWDARFSRPVQHGAKLLFEDVPTIEEELASLSAPADPWVFVAHAPPVDTHLDRAFGNKPFGSVSIRKAIERHQPLLSLHGHIHESPSVSGRWRDTLGKTVAVNPGQSSRHLSYVVIEIDVPGQRITSMEHGQQP